MYWPNLEVIALLVPEIIAIGVLGGVRTSILGKGRPQRVGDGTVRKSASEFL